MEAFINIEREETPGSGYKEIEVLIEADYTAPEPLYGGEQHPEVIVITHTEGYCLSEKETMQAFDAIRKAAQNR